MDKYIFLYQCFKKIVRIKGLYIGEFQNLSDIHSTAVTYSDLLQVYIFRTLRLLLEINRYANTLYDTHQNSLVFRKAIT